MCCALQGKEEAQRIKKYCRGKWKAFGQMRCGRGDGSRGCSGWVMVTTTPDSRLIEMRVCIDKKQNGIRAKHSRGHDSLIMRPGH